MKTGHSTLTAGLGRDIRHALRTLAGMPVLATVVIVSLGIGIGVNVAVFSWLQTFLFKPLPGVADAASFQLVESRAEAGSYPGASWLEYRDLQERLRALPDLLAFRMVPLNVGEAPRNERVYGLLVSGNYFSALGLRPARGRFLRPDEVVTAGREPAVVISYDLWQTRFGGAADVLAQRLRVNDRELTIVGITPEGFQGTVLGIQFDVWVPATLAPVLLNGSRELEDRGLRGYYVMGQLGPDATREQAQAELRAAMQQLAQLYPATNETMTGEVLPFWRAPRGPQGMFLGALAILQGIMLLLLLAVCGNTANLLLARATARQREIGVRLAIGAGPWRIVRLLIVENLMLAIPGAVLGVLLALWSTATLRALPIVTMVPVRFQTGVDAVGLAVAIALAIGCALLFGLAPAVQLARVDPQRVLGSSARPAPRTRLRNALMAAQVALALVVLLVAGLFLRSFADTRLTDPGFRREGILLAAYDFSGRQVDDAYARDFARQLLDRLRQVPAVDTAAISASLPLDIHGLPLRGFTLEGRARTDGSTDRALSNIVTPGYFEIMGIALREGTDFADLADTVVAPQAIVNEEFVRRYIDNGAAIGRRLESSGRTYAIAGVVRNSVSESLGEAPIPIVYYSYRDRPRYSGEIHVRTRAGDETLLASDVRRAVRDIDPERPLYNVRTMTEHVETNLFLRRIPARLFVVLGPLLLLLAAIGIYAVVAYSVAHRTMEIGVRLALGATAGGVVGQVVRDTLRVIGAGALTAWLLVFAAYMHLGSGLLGVGESTTGPSIDVAAFVGVPAVLMLVATVACWIPARRASRIDPIVALRQE